MTAPVRLRSKRNEVTKILLPDGTQGVVKDFGENLSGYETELAMVRRLGAAGVPVAPVLAAKRPVITYRFLEGETLADLLDEAEGSPERRELLRGAFCRLALWLSGYYPAARDPGSGRITILGDAHLRNFLLLKDGTVAGVDFECCRPGSPEEDVARLGVFTVAYDPPGTPVKTRLAALLLEECRRELSLDASLLRDHLSLELFQMEKRRGRRMDPALIAPLLSLL